MLELSSRGKALSEGRLDAATLTEDISAHHMRYIRKLALVFLFIL